MLFQPRNPRRGVLLLVVMALLALMATVTMTFVLVSGVQMRSARGTALADLDTNSHEALLDGAMDQLLRGAEDPSSPIWTHSLLEDLYGHDTRLGPLTGSVSATPNAPRFQENGTFVELSLDFDNKRIDPMKPSLHPNQSPGFYDGRLLTMLSGSTAFVTRRIVRSDPTGAGNVVTFQVMSFGGGLPKVGDKFIINDRPFDGTGFGLGLQAALMAGQEIADGTFDETIDHALASGGIARPRALLPNHGRVANSDAELFDPQYPDPSGLGMADEDYDAPDYQNMHLAVMVADPTFGTKVIKPSFHDPALMNYFLGAGATDRPTTGSAAERDLARKLLFRPLVSDHPDFLQVNPAFDTVDWFKQGPWDVDNDGNGDPDSIWMDLGSPVQTDASGRQYKPLYAILCVDLDGRLNLNAHGSPMHLVRTGNTWPPRREFVGPFANTSGLAQLPLGQGYGPADIMLNHLFMSGAPTAAIPNMPHDLFYLFHGNPDQYKDGTNVSVAGRYGESQLFDYTTATTLNDSMDTPPMPGRTSQWTVAGNWGVDNRDDDLDGVVDGYSDKALTEVKDALTGGMYDDNFPSPPIGAANPLNLRAATEQFRGDAMASLAYDGTNPRGAFGTPGDIDGDGAVALDLRGNPIYASHGEGDDAIDDPYEIELMRDGAQRRRAAADGTAGVADVDAPFSPADLEVLLRIYDADVGTLSSRLLTLAEDTFVNQSPQRREFLRGIFTTESWDSPTASTMVGIPEFASSYDPFVMRGSSFLEKILDTSDLPKSDIPNELRKVLYPRFFDGLKLNLNRPFGNLVDDDGDGVVDEPGEFDTMSTMADPLWQGDLASPATFDFDNDNYVDNAATPAELIKQGNQARQAMARHLYLLAMLYRNLTAPTLGNPKITQRELAQWAINAVDFRDRDSIMTAFEYDENPYDGWTVDGDLSTTTDTDRAVVWGVERPELLITETLAGHDRGTDDTSNGMGGKTATGMPTGTDADYDQVARPDGWVMIELYNPQSRMATPSRPPSDQMFTPSKPPAELYDRMGTTGDGLWLSREAPSNSPVWRIAVGQPSTTTHPAPTDDERKDPVLDAADIERTIYLKQPGAGITNGGSVQYYPSAATEISVNPGSYVVLGSQGVTLEGVATSVNEIGRGLSAMDQPKIDLNVTPPTPTDANKPLIHTGLLSMDVADDGMATPYPTLSSGSAAETDEEIIPPVAVQIDMPRRMSISEPVGGYPIPFVIGDIANVPYDEPWDKSEDEPWFSGVQQGTTNEARTYKVVAYNRVYLQRLANPTLAWNQDTNPYLTVDSMPIDLWVYNSSADADGATAVPDAIRSRERLGDAMDEDDPDTTNMNIWRQWSGDVTPGAVDSNHANGPTPTDPTVKLQHTLGYLNSVWHSGAAPDHRWWTAAEFAKPANMNTLGNGVSAVSRLYDQAYFIGAPLTPFPWFTWNDRPYASKYELMLVPKSSPSELFAEYSTLNGATQPYLTNEEGEYSRTYDPAGGADSKSHLLNFFYRSDKDGNVNRHNDLYRIFEFVDVPSRFSGLEEMLDPTTFEATATAPTGATIFGWGLETNPKRNFAPPYNYLSKYREPGKVNINTVFDDGSTWRAMLGGFDNGYSQAPDWDKIQKSRRGYLPAAPILDGSRNPTLDISTPTLMARPFRSFSGGHFAPTDALRHEGIESTLLRSDPNTPAQPLLALTSATEDTNTSKNPYFRYQLINRLSNMVTTRSNVYAVWITVGYFEVEPVDRSDPRYPADYMDPEFDRVFPDGYRLKGELGADTGEIERHRAFYMVDRLVPVAFERGKTHNTRKTIRLRTMIE